MRIHLRGELRLEVDGRRVEGGLPGRLGRALLAYLVLTRHRQATRDELVGALWPATPPRDPAATLSTLLSSLRRALGPELLRGRSELRLELPPEAEVDVEVAAAELRDAREALAADPEQACLHARAALDVYESPLVPLFDAPWLEEHRRAQEDEQLEALELFAEASLALGGDGPAHAQLAARQLVELAPFRESGHGLLMRAHAARGNQAEALRVYDRLRMLLRDELGSTPSAELRALHEELLTATAEPAEEPEHKAPAPPAGVPLPPVLAKVDDLPFVGRERALASLGAELAAAAAGDRRGVLVAGEPGIGKTSLAAAFAREAEGAGAVVLYGRSDEDGLVPYQPFVDMVVHLARSGRIDEFGESLRSELAELGRLVPELRRHMPPTRSPSSGVPETNRYRLFEAAATILGRLGAERPVVLLFDDLHWADSPTLRLLRHLAQAHKPSRLLMVAAYRDVEVERSSAVSELIADVRRELPLATLELEGLDERETGELIEAVRGSAPEPGVAARLRELTGGNPFFMEESLRASTDPEGVPAGVREVVRRRIARLGPNASQVLGVAAVMGPSFATEAVAPVADLRRDEVAKVLDSAVAARLLTDIDDSGRLLFAHALIRRTLYDELGGVVRTHLHERVAETLESRRAQLRPRSAELAHHFYEARHSLGPEPALRYARDAADQAAEAFAWEDAAAHLERALELDELRSESEAGERCELMLRLGEMQLRAGNPAFTATFGEAATLARGRSSRQLARIAICYAGRYSEAGVIDEQLLELLRDALTELGPGEPELRARLLARLAEVLHFAGDEGGSVARAAESVDIAERLGDDHLLADALAGRHVSLLHVSHVKERLAVSAAVIQLARAMRDRERTLDGQQARIFDLCQAGHVAAAKDVLADYTALADEVKQPLYSHWAVGWAGAFAQMEGRLEEAERLAAESFAMRQRMETADAENVFAAQLFMIRMGQGRLAELVPAIERLIGEYPALAPWRAGLPLAYVAAGREADAVRELERFVSNLDQVPRDFFWLTAVVVAGEASGKLGHRESADVLYELLAPYAGCLAVVGYAGCLGPVSRMLGLLAEARGERDAAVGHLEDALASSEAAGLRLFETQARGDLESLLTPSG